MKQMIVGRVLIFVGCQVSVLTASAVAAEPDSPPASHRTCKADVDCEFVPSSCCGPAISINARHKSSWQKKVARSCGRSTCPAVIDQTLLENVPICEAGTCGMRRIRDFGNAVAADCERQTRPEEAAICFSQVALRTLNYDLCARIQPQCLSSSRESCGLDVLAKRIQSGAVDEAFCKSLKEPLPKPDARDVCFQSVAMRLKQPALCHQLRNDQSKHSCLTSVLPEVDDESACTALAAYPKALGASEADCWLRLAEKKPDLRLCDKIAFSPNTWADNFGHWYNCVVQVAKSRSQPDLCTHLKTRSRPQNYPENAFGEPGCRRRVSGPS